MTPESIHRLNTSRPDGFFALKSRPKVAAAPKRIRWCDIAVVAEFKKVKNIDNIDDNVDKLLWGMNHLMSEDICRDFVYGFTIENTSMRMWYCDRSNVVVSEEFDIHKDNATFLSFCLAILYATKEELGWDSTIEPVEPSPLQVAEKDGEEQLCRVEEVAQTSEGPQDDKKVLRDPKDPDASVKPARYIISVRIDEQVTHRFITTSPISLRGADGIRGRGTRVWRARELIDGKEDGVDVAIKDYWIDDDWEREGHIVKSIADAAPDEACRTQLKNHIVEILCHGDVYREHTSIDRRSGKQPVLVKKMGPDSTRDLKEAIERSNCVIDLQHPKAAPTSVPSQHDQLASGEHTPVAPSDYFVQAALHMRPLPGVKTRNRLVMKQVGKPLHAEDSLCSVFRGLMDASNGLHAIHSSGWMHRDISTGNIVLYKDRGILIDFEYAKRIPKEGEAVSQSHGGRTGTPYFMAVEVQLGSYIFAPPEKQKFGIYDEKPASRLPPPGLAHHPPPAASEEETKSKSPINPRKRVRGRKSDGPDGALPEEYPGQALEDDPASDKSLPGHGVLATYSSSPFVYNPMHDFEALVWVGNYFVFNRMVDDAGTQQQPQELNAQIVFARSLFSGSVEHRWKLLNAFHLGKTATFYNNVRQLHPSLRDIGKLMGAWMDGMTTLYWELESRDPVAIASSPAALKINGFLLPFLGAIVDVLSKHDVKVKLLPMSMQPVVPVKTDKEQEASTRPAQNKPRKG